MHTAHIKVNRKDVQYKFIYEECITEYEEKIIYNLRKRVSVKSGYITMKINSSLSTYIELINSLIYTRGISNKYYNTGIYTIETRDLKLDVLNKGVHIYVEALGDYYEITNVEVNLDGSVNYYVDVFVYHEDEHTNNRYESIVEWMEYLYPDAVTFSDLAEYKDGDNELQPIYNKYIDIINKAHYNDITSEEVETVINGGKLEDVIEDTSTEEALVDSDSEYTELSYNHYAPKIEIVNESESRATFAMIMFIAMIIGIMILCGVTILL